MKILPAVFATLLLTLLPHPSRAAQSYDGCTGFITSLPATLSTQGVWCMDRDLATGIVSGAAITVATNNVTIDCNDFKLGGLSAGQSTSAYGILANNRLNLTVRNCNIRGFFMGVRANGTGGGHVVEHSRFESNRAMAAFVSGDSSTIRGNLVFDTGGTTLGGGATAIYAMGEVDVLDNTVDGVYATTGTVGAAIGIEVDGGSGTIGGNRVRNVIHWGEAESVGIYANTTGFQTVQGNQVVGVAQGLGSVYGIYCGIGSVRARDNSVSNHQVGLASCTDGGGNHIVPIPG